MGVKECDKREGDRKNTIEMNTKKLLKWNIFTFRTKFEGKKANDGNFSGKFSDTLHNFRFVFFFSYSSSFPFDLYTLENLSFIPFHSVRFGFIWLNFDVKTKKEFTLCVVKFGGCVQERTVHVCCG